MLLKLYVVDIIEQFSSNFYYKNTSNDSMFYLYDLNTF
jgi:hypothetical protein